MACDRVVSDLMLPLWEEVLWPFLDACVSVRLRTTSAHWNVRGRYGLCGELFFFPFEERADGPQGVGSVWAQHPSRSSDSMCLGRGLLMMAEDNSWRSDSGSSVSSSSSRENNVGDDALFVTGLRHNCPLPTKLGGGKGSFELPYCPGRAVPGIVRS